MNIMFEALTFLGGCLFYAFRGAVGKVLLAVLVKIAKHVFRVTSEDVASYKQHKTTHLATKRLGKARAH